MKKLNFLGRIENKFISKEKITKFFFENNCNFNLKKLHDEIKINNIYFDTLENDFYHDHIEGSNSRIKVRIRWYDKSDYFKKKFYLEIKSKFNDIIVKDKILLDIKNINELDNQFVNDYFNLLMKKNKIDYYGFVYLQSFLYNQYFRSYYYLNNDKDNRLTYDTNVLFSRASDIKISPIRYKCKYDIIEHKFTNENQKNNLRLSINNIQNQSFSKYIYGMDAIYSLD